jgi:hypothetical protein
MGADAVPARNPTSVDKGPALCTTRSKFLSVPRVCIRSRALPIPRPLWGPHPHERFNPSVLTQRYLDGTTISLTSNTYCLKPHYEIRQSIRNRHNRTLTNRPNLVEILTYFIARSSSAGMYTVCNL